MANYDVKKAFPRLYAPRAGRIETVDVPPLTCFRIDGHGDPNVAGSYTDAVTTLFTVSYAARAVAKAELGRVHTVGPLEGLWSAEDPTVFATRDKAAWDWTMLITQPEWVTAEVADAATAAARRKGAPAVDLLRFEELHEGRSVQVLHVGSYDDEGPVLARLHASMSERGLTWNGPHHEVYLSDPRRTAPEKLRTVLRQPVRAAR